jgi:DNA-binding beta-propeller fold protein YncE
MTTIRRLGRVAAMRSAFGALLLALLDPLAHASTLALTGTIPLPGVSGRIDHCAIDASGHRLFVAALGNNTVEVVDLAAGRVARSLAGFSEPQGIAYVADLKRIAVANGGNGDVMLLDGTSFAVVATIPLGDDADNVRYDAAQHRVWVGYGAGGLAAIDPATHRIETRIELAGHPESFQLEPGGTRIFVNVPQSREVVVVDRNAKRVTANRRLVSAAANFPLAVDEKAQCLFVACRSPGRLLVLSTAESDEIAQADLHRDCDDVFYDAARHRVYASCGEGYIDVFSVDRPGAIKRIESIATAAGARTSGFDGDHLYLAVQQRAGHEAEIRVYDLASPGASK